MRCFKSAQIPDFIDTDVRRVFGYASSALFEQKNEELMRTLTEAEQDLQMNNPHISLDELKLQPVWKLLQSILQPSVPSTPEEHWTSNPNKGI